MSQFCLVPLLSCLTGTPPTSAMGDHRAQKTVGPQAKHCVLLKALIYVSTLRLPSWTAFSLCHSSSQRLEKTNRDCLEGKGRIGVLATKALFVQEKSTNTFNQFLKYRKEKKIIFTFKSPRIVKWGKKGQLVFNLIKTCSWWKFILHI